MASNLSSQQFDEDEEIAQLGAFALQEESELDMYDAQQLVAANGSDDVFQEPTEHESS